MDIIRARTVLYVVWDFKSVSLHFQFTGTVYLSRHLLKIGMKSSAQKRIDIDVGSGCGSYAI